MPRLEVLHKYVKCSPPDGQANNNIEHIQYQASTRWGRWERRRGERYERGGEERRVGKRVGVRKREGRLQELRSRGKYSTLVTT